MIRVAIVDDHHAVRIGLEAVLSAEPDMDPVGVATNAAETAPLLYRASPDVLIVDYRLPDVDGLTLCRRIKAAPPAPRVILHSAYADDWLTLPAMLAGADGVVHKGAPGRELAEAIRTVAHGGSALPAVDADALRTSAEALDPDDLPILGMLAHGSPVEEIASALGLAQATLRARRHRMLDALRSPTLAHR